EEPLARRHAAEQVQHAGMAPRGRVAERPIEHRAQVILELARFGALDRPMAGVVDARCDLVREQSVPRRKELDREYAAIIEALEDRAQPTLGLTLEPFVLERCNGGDEDTVAVRILG